ncbi:MAG TPA: hypothetical protein VN326_12185 [Casimicrobiaceae bacterium]|nr:hypothetical protein [Casimicrobiaceae bacterium]
MLRTHGLRDPIAMLDGFRHHGMRTTIGAALLVVCGLSPLWASAALVLSSDGITVYDTVNNISWLADANLAAANRFGLPLCTGSGTQTCINASGSMRYDAAVAWVQAMNAASYLGHSNWQLPTTPTNDSGCGKTGPTGDNFGFGCTASAFGSLWNALRLKAPNTAVSIPSNTVGPFSNLQPYLYWSQSGAPPPAGNFTFSFATGWQGANTLPNFLYALPMVPGKLPGTPPATGSGLQVNPGGQTVYDPVTNITWLSNANLAATNTFGLPTCKDPTTPAICVASDGAMTFASASQFIGNMNAFNGAGYLGQTNWQLPTIESSCPGYNCAGNQNPMGNLFYDQLHFSQGMTVVTVPNVAVGPFKNIQPYLYWACEAATIQQACQTDGPAPNFEWSFSFGSGFQGTDLLANDLYVMVYYPGSPTAFPANYQGLWWAAPAGSESGWGINFAHQGDTIFASWFTYDASGKGLWLVMTAPKTGNGVYSGTFYRLSGPAFNTIPFPPLGSPGGAVATAVGSGTLTFSDANNGSFAYTINGIAQTKPITRQIFGAVPICIYGAAPDFALAYNYQDLWWAIPPGSEAGWGINLTHQGDTIFATWFTYDQDRTPMWLVVTANNTAPGTYSGNQVFRLTGPPFSSVPFPPQGNPGGATGINVGTAKFTFSDGNTGTFMYTVNGITQTKNITRELFRPPAGTVCQ